MNIRILSGAALVAVLSGCATATASFPPVSVPDALQAPAGHKLSLEVNGTGVQIYVCSPAKANPAQTEWAFKAPEATLTDAAGVVVGKHYAGPTWEGKDGSKVVGEVKAKHDDPAGKAIPWLLLSAKSASGDGVFSRVTFIQRLATEAGNAPADGCTAADLGKEARVPYKALYRFYVAS
ncbi:DUF3455 domain-containing protein [Janthinobacterium agaricidamnosum]|uniref:DUF3455 domain-containing protein n=1 Tax=Janthinobacterium agaricidamnosum NBRC 102515 = DSM 9628 TaxID=1349767 RepID=W0VA86_9BURK|nr:DUF3455 domain-containing protein [Janthinobacterium agaricidamnosum]CDG85734.1 putative uncharacterized protein [Janthinobacterium agaricidamnosum NBRC 102515 = DSM 9628]